MRLPVYDISLNIQIKHSRLTCFCKKETILVGGVDDQELVVVTTQPDQQNNGQTPGVYEPYYTYRVSHYLPTFVCRVFHKDFLFFFHNILPSPGLPFQKEISVK